MGGLFVLASVFFIAPSQAEAANRYWVGSAGGSWNSTANWSTSQSACGANTGASVPTSSDLAVFNASCTNSAALDSTVTVLGFSIAAGYSGTLTQGAGIGITVGASGWAQAGGTFTGSTGTFTLNGAFALFGGTFTAPSGTFNASGNWTQTAGTFNAGTNTVTFTAASGTQTFNSGGTSFYNIVHSGAGTLSLTTSSLTVTNSLTNSAGAFSLSGQNLILTGATFTMTSNALFLLQGIETITGMTQDTANGTWRYLGRNVVETITIKDFGATDYQNIVIYDLNSNKATFRLGANLSVAGGLTVTGGTYDTNSYSTTVAGGTIVNGGTFQGSAGSVSLATMTLSSGTFNAPSGTFTVSGTWTKSGGTFTPGTGTVTLNGTSQTMSGSTTFYNLTKSDSAGSTLTFVAGTTQTVTNLLTLSGTSGHRLLLRSGLTGTRWNINPASVSLSYIDVRDSDNAAVAAIDCSASHCADSGNNENWTFYTSAGAVTVTDEKLVWSPYTWKFGGSTYAQAVPSGAYVKVAFSGHALALKIDTSLNTGVDLSTLNMNAYIDGSSTPVSKTLAQLSDGYLTFSGSLLDTDHYAIVYFSLNTGTADRWSTPLNSLRITKVQLASDGSGEALDLEGTPLERRLRKVMLFGDSITEGSGTGDAAKAYGSIMAQLLDVEYGQLGYAGMFWNAVGTGGVPKFYDLSSPEDAPWRWYDANASRLVDNSDLSLGFIDGAPDAVFINLGINDANGSTSKADLRTKMTLWIADIRSAAGDDTAIFPIVPFNLGNMSNASYQEYKAAFLGGVTDYLSAHPAEERIFPIDLGSSAYDTVIANTSDSVHPNTAGALILGTDLADLVEPDLLTGQVTLTSSYNPSEAGARITYTASVRPRAATGTVEIRNGSSVIGTVSLSHGSGSISVSTLPVGSHSITGVYSGDGDYLSGTSAALLQVVVDDDDAASGGGTGGDARGGGRSGAAATVRDLFRDRLDGQVRSSSGSVTQTGSVIRQSRGYLEVTKNGVTVVYRDVPTDSWFAPFVSFLIEHGIADGYKDALGKLTGEFGVGNPVTYGEIAKMALNAGRPDLSTARIPRNRSAQGTFAAPYVALAEQLGLSVFSSDLDVALPATRGAVIQTVLEAFGVNMAPVTAVSFRDLGIGHRHAAAIQDAFARGIIGGDTDATGKPTGTVRPDEPVNRAEAAKIVSLALTLLGK